MKKSRAKEIGSESGKGPAILDKMIRKDSFEEMTFEQRPG